MKYNIHVTENRTDINVIKKEIILDDGEVKNIHNRTSFIKNFSGFQIVFCRILPKLSTRESNKSYSGTDFVSFGSYNPRYFTLCLSMFVGYKSLEFDPPNLNFDSAFKSVIMGEFRLVFFYSYWFMYALDIGNVWDDIDTENNADSRLITEPLGPVQCIRQHQFLRNSMRKDRLLLIMTNNKVKKFFGDALQPVLYAHQYPVDIPAMNSAILKKHLRKAYKNKGIAT